MLASLRDWLPEDHLACFVVEAVELLDGAKLRGRAQRTQPHPGPTGGGGRADAGPAPRGRIPTALSPRERLRRKLTTKRGRRLYEPRRWMLEPVFGDIKENRGVRRFQRRGFEACASEWTLIAATHNLRKLYRHRLKQPSPDPSCRPALEPPLEPRRSGPIGPNPARCITGGCRTTAPNRLLRNR